MTTTKDQKSVQEQLSEVRAQRDKLTAERSKRDEERKLVDELEREKQALIDEEALAKLEAEHPASKIRAVQTDLGLVVIKRPRAVEYQRFVDKAEAKFSGFNAFVSPCVLYPSAQRFSQILEELPAILPHLVTVAAQLAGSDIKEREAK